MATSTDPLQRAQVAIQARDTGDRYQAPTTNAALQLASSLRSMQPVLEETLQGIAANEAEKQRAQAHKDALMNKGQVLADAVREGKLPATQNPWYMEAYAKEGAAIRSQSAFSKLQLDSATWAEQNNPAAFEKKWRESVAEIAKGFSGKDEAAGFNPVEAQFTQQTLAGNLASNRQRIITERGQNNSALAAEALTNLAKVKGGVLTAEEAIGAMAPAKALFIGTGGTEQEWHTMSTQAIISAATSTRNPGLIDLTKAIGLDGKAVVEGAFGSGAEDHPVRTPTAQLATSALPPAHALPVQGGVTVEGGTYGAARGHGKVHHGLDLAVPEGTTVVSPGMGTVLEVGHDGEAGNFVRIDHGNGLVSSYSHLSSTDLKAGDQVTAGQAIALSGNTGRSTGPHVHWRTKVNGVDVNPKSVAFPQGVSPQSGQPQGQAPQGAVAEVAAGLNAPPADAPQPPPVIAKGPSLFDISGQASDLANARYRIQQSQEFEITARARAMRAKLQVAGQEAVAALYDAHGTALLMGNYDVKALTRELEAKGYKAQEIGAALNQLHEDTSASVGVMNNRLRLNGSDPTSAKRIFDLAAQGEKQGYSEGYDHAVGQAVLAGDISAEEGIQFVSRARAYTRAQQAEARAEARARRAEEAANPNHVHSYAQLKQQAGYLSGLAAQNYFTIVGHPMDDYGRKRVEKRVSDAMGAYLVGHQGDYDGAVTAGRDVVAAHTKQTLLDRGRNSEQFKGLREAVAAAKGGGQ